MNELKESIDIQIESNQSKNLFFKDISNIMQISLLTFSTIQMKNFSDEDISILIDYTTEKVLQEFCRVNQYFSFSENNIITLKTIYWNLYRSIRRKKIFPADISKHHFNNLQNWLKETNPFSVNMYRQQGAVLEAVTCSEYSFELQKDILSLNNIELLEPVLDIGCGKNGSLVKSLLNDNIDAYGIDRFANDSPHFEKADWLVYNYGIRKWGTIISNLGFSNHFTHHHLRSDGNIVQYAKTYMNILQSLKTGGCFCYVPDLPFIEIYLDEKMFEIKKHSIKNMLFKAAIITRLK